MSGNVSQISMILSGVITDPARPVPHLLPGKSYLHLFEPGSQLYRICEALESTLGWLSTLDLHHACGSMAVSTKVSQVRARGVPIERKTEAVAAKQVHYYRLMRDRAA